MKSNHRTFIYGSYWYFFMWRYVISSQNRFSWKQIPVQFEQILFFTCDCFLYENYTFLHCKRLYIEIIKIQKFMHFKKI